MRVALTGATGFIGSHVLTELMEHGHEVTALVRDDAQAAVVAARGATPAVVDLYDRTTVLSLLSDADGAIHTASPGDETSANLDSAVVDAAIEAFTSTGKPYLHISGQWIYGDNSHITEDSRLNAPALVSWKEPIYRRVLDAKGMRGVVILCRRLRRRRRRHPGLLLGSPRDDAGNLIMLGRGNSTGRRSTSPTWRTSSGAFSRTTRPWPLRHRRWSESDRRRNHRSGRCRRRRTGRGARLRRRGSGPPGRLLRGVLLLDQGSDAAKARAELDWRPSHPGLVDEFRNGSYRNGGGNR